MQMWEEWRSASASAGRTTLAWDAWYARQQRIRDSMKCRQGQASTSTPFSDQELARLSFMRWLYQIGRLDPQTADG